MNAPVKAMNSRIVKYFSTICAKNLTDRPFA